MAYYAPFYQPTYYPQPTARQDVPQYNQQYQPMAQPTQQTPTTQQVGNGLIWVQGVAGANAYLDAPGNTVMLMDSEEERFYLKSADASGMPMPLRIFDYKESTNAPVSDFKAPASDFSELDDKYITREEFERRMASIGSGCKCKEHKKNKLTEDADNGEQSV